MFCPKCGTENPEEAKLCRVCSWVLTSVGPKGPLPDAKTSALAVTSLILGILSFCTFLLTAPAAFILGIISVVMIAKSRGHLKGMGFAITGIVVPVVALPFVAIPMGIMMPALVQARFAARQAVCRHNLNQLGVATMMYAEDNDDQYPAADKWSDLLEKYTRDDKLYVCPSAKQGKCNYAMNGNLPKNRNQIRRPEKLVLLFESKPGWNQSGGPELLTTENHRGKGCNVVFCDGHVEFVKAEDINSLKWTAGP